MNFLLFLTFVVYTSADEHFSLVEIAYDHVLDPSCYKGTWTYEGKERTGCIEYGGYEPWCSYDQKYVGNWNYCKRVQRPDPGLRDNFEKKFAHVESLEKQLSALTASAAEQKKCACMAQINIINKEIKETETVLKDQDRRILAFKETIDVISSMREFELEIRAVWPKILQIITAQEAKIAPKPVPPKVVKATDHTKDCTTSVCYLFYKKRANYRSAKAFCEAIKSDGGYHLTVPSGRANTIWLAAKGREYKCPRFWIDGNDMARERVWVDFKNRPIPKANLDWYRGEPNNVGGGPGEDCIQMGRFPNHQLNDANCNANLSGFVCSNSK